MRAYSDIVFISVSLAADRLPLGYRFLIVAPIIEGILGGNRYIPLSMRLLLNSSIQVSPPDQRQPMPI
jgi:hypothetical protein